MRFELTRWRRQLGPQNNQDSRKPCTNFLELHLPRLLYFARWDKQPDRVTDYSVVAHRPIQNSPRTFRPRYRETASGEERNIFTLHIVLYQGLHPVAAQSSDGQRDATSRIRKAGAGKLPKRAGATPLFRLSAAQKVRGVAPALFNTTRQSHCRVHKRRHRRVVRHAWRWGRSTANNPQGEIIFASKRHKFPSRH